MSDNELKLERFGRYLILDHLVDGGMAKISRARFLGEQADKIVAIKMIQQQFSEDESFKAMFESEIKVTFGLIHPNIAQTYDYGTINNQLYTAMEYVDGKNLKEFLDQLKERNFVFPVEISVHICSQVCQGLNYAHTFSDKLTGKRANIIHRDISPHNIMITYDGAVKVIDFGIAKAETNTDATQAGTIKGKLSYLAPEYLDGQALDPRYDEFALGITLWEMLCSRKLFKASNELAILKEIQACEIPAPSSINPNVPKELDEIVLKALSKDRNDRFENLDKLNRALVKFLYSNYSDFNPTDLAYFAKELFKENIKLDREKLFKFGQIDLQPYLNDLQNELNGSGQESGQGDILKSKKKEVQELDFGFDEDKSIKLKGDKPPVIVGGDGSGDVTVKRKKKKKKKKKSGKIISGQTRTDIKDLRRMGSLDETSQLDDLPDMDDIDKTKTKTRTRTKTKTKLKTKKGSGTGTKTKTGLKNKKIKGGTGTVTKTKTKTKTKTSKIKKGTGTKTRKTKIRKSRSSGVFLKGGIAASIAFAAAIGYFLFVADPSSDKIARMVRTIAGMDVEIANVKVKKTKKAKSVQKKQVVNDDKDIQEDITDNSSGREGMNIEDPESSVEDRVPSSIDKTADDKEVKPVEKKIKEYGKLILSNFKKYKHKVYLNGKKQMLFGIAEINLEVGKDYQLRVQSPGKKHFVKHVMIDKPSDKINIEIPQQEIISYGYLTTSRDCVQGTLSFELFGEKREEPLPIKSGKGIEFPSGVDVNGKVNPIEYSVSYKRIGDDNVHKAKFVIKHQDDLVDFCENL